MTYIGERILSVAILGLLSVSCMGSDTVISLEDLAENKHIPESIRQRLVLESDLNDLYTLYSIASGLIATDTPIEDLKSLALWKHVGDQESDDVPVFMIDYDEGNYYWTVNGEWALCKGERISVGRLSSIPKVSLNDGNWAYSWEEDSQKHLINQETVHNHPAIYIDEKSDLYSSLVFPSGHRVPFLSEKGKELVDKKVPQKAFYKDLFLDEGIGLNLPNAFYAARNLNLSIEGISFEDKKDYIAQSQIIGGSEIDTNGRLLYPDGQPRYGMLYVAGGNSRTHGEFLGERGLTPLRTFVSNGGVYIGTCAGAFLACNGYDDHTDYDYYLNIWPGMMRHSGLTSATIGMKIPVQSPLLKYYDYGGDYYVADIRHIKGGYPYDIPDGTEILAYVDYPSKESFNGQPAIWAYKENSFAGRVCLTGSHPERANKGEVLDLMTAVVRYAQEGQGLTRIKGFLNKGETRMMDKETMDHCPAYTRIGDRQCHHFVVYIPEGATNVSVTLKGAPDYDMALMMDHETYAYPDAAHFVSASSGPEQNLTFPQLEPGFWYIAVQCMTTVDATESQFCQEYSGRTEVLNGVPYSITVYWDDLE